MESDANYRAFLERRRKFLEDWNRLNNQIDDLLDKLGREKPTVQDAALVEGLRAERHRLFNEYENAADEWVTYLLRAIGSREADREG